MKIGRDRITKPDRNLQINDQSIEYFLPAIPLITIKRMNPAINPRKVYLIQKRADAIRPDIKASVFVGRSLLITIDLRAKKKQTVNKGKQSSSALPPKLNIPNV